MYMFVSAAWAILFFTDTIQIWHACTLLVIHGIAGVFWAVAWQRVSPAQFGPEVSMAVLAIPVIGLVAFNRTLIERRSNRWKAATAFSLRTRRTFRKKPKIWSSAWASKETGSTITRPWPTRPRRQRRSGRCGAACAPSMSRTSSSPTAFAGSTGPCSAACRSRSSAAAGRRRTARPPR